jgi:DNA-binding transcriptional MocR family regulator
VTPEAIEQAMRGWVDFDAGNLPQRLSLAIRHLINTGVLTPGEQLPAERPLAIALGVSRPTVTSALDDLRRSGHLVSRQGSGTRVASTRQRSVDRQPFTGAVLDHDGINLAAAVPFDASHLPPVSLGIESLMSSEPAHGVAPLGLEQLRQSAAKRLDRAGLGFDPESVVVTNGADDALRTVFETLAVPSSVVVVDELTYGGVAGIAKRAGVNLIGVPRDREGIDPDRLSQTMRRTHPSVVLVATTIHNPTGTATTPARIAELARILNDHDVPVVVDETYADLHYRQRPFSLAASLDAPYVVIESLSKSAWSGLRIGWITASADLLAPIARARHPTLGVSIPSQLLAAALLDTDFDDFLARRRATLQTKSRLLADMLTAADTPWRTETIDGGLATWIAVDTAERATVDAAHAAGVHVTAGSTFHVDGHETHCIRVCHDRPAEVLQEAVSRLSTLWRGRVPRRS